MIKRIATFVLFLLIIASPAGLQWWLTRTDRLRFEAVAHASAESTDLLQSAPMYRPRKPVIEMIEIPDRFVELLLEQSPQPPPSDTLARTWFPKTFLWAPQVVTDENGHATVDFAVPDTLTRWRVVGQSLTEGGDASGGRLRFATEKPAHVTVFLPEHLRTGDRVSLPLEAVNRTATPLETTLTVRTQEATLLSEAITLESSQPVVSVVPLEASAPGTTTLTATLGAQDDVQLPLRGGPAGWASQIGQGGAVVPRRSVSFSAGRAGTLRLQVFPVQATLEAARAAATTPEDRSEALYSWSLACLLEDEALRRTAEVAIRHSPPADDSEGQSEYGASLLAEMLAERLCGARPPHTGAARWWSQLDDGSWPAPAGAPLSQLVSATALHTVRAGDPVTSLQSSAFIERHGGRVTDPFSAAALLWTGLPDAHLTALLQKTVRLAAEIAPSGQVSVRASGTRPDGVAASAVDILAMAALVMPPEEAATYRAALAGRLSATGGWGDGFSGLLALTALHAAPEAHPNTTLQLSGSAGPLGSARLGEDLVVSVPAGDHDYTLLADGPAADVAWRLTLEQWHTEDTQAPALDAVVSTPAQLARGERGTVSIRITAPTEAPVTVSHALPAGVKLVPGTARVAGSPIPARSRAGGLTVELPANRPETLTVSYDVQATLTGTVHSGGVHIQSGDQQIWRAAGRRWRIDES